MTKLSQKTYTRIMLIRHPETVANVEHRYVGRGDTDYTARGRREADELVEALGVMRPGLVVSSPSPRCSRVARRIAEATGATFEVMDDLAEIDFGAAEGLTYDEASRMGISMDLLGGPADGAAFEGGETWSDLSRRVCRSMLRLAGVGGCAVVLTHSGFIRQALTAALEAPHTSAWHLAVAHASVSVLTVSEEYAVLEAFGLPASSALTWAEGCRRP